MTCSQALTLKLGGADLRPKSPQHRGEPLGWLCQTNTNTAQRICFQRNLHNSNLLPFNQSSFSFCFENVSLDQMALMVEVIVDCGMGGRELLQGFYIPVFGHCVFSSRKRLMLVFGPVVDPPPACLIISVTEHYHRSPIKPKPVCNNNDGLLVMFHCPL